MKTKFVAMFTFVCGLILLGVGGAILLTPEAFHASNGIALQTNASLMSEIRAPGGLLFASGLLITVGSFRHKLRSQAVILATLVYGTFGVARLPSMALDGMPSKGIVGATAIELIVAAIGLALLTRKAESIKIDSLTDPTPTAATATH